MSVRVLFADDHAPTRADIRRVLASADRVELCAEADDAASAVSAAARERPDVCLLDVDMPGGGIAAAWEIRARMPDTKIVFLTVSDADRDLFAALRTGASGYLLKDMDLRELPALLCAAAAGEGVLPGPLTARVLAEYRADRPRRETLPADGRPTFTSREWDVLELLQFGLETRQIARRLSLTPATVRSHIASIVKKAGAADRDDALALLGSP